MSGMAGSNQVGRVGVSALGPVMLDVVGTSLTADDIRRTQQPLTSGVILLTRNCQDQAQLTTLTAAIHAARSGILIAADHEGERVQRFRSDGFTRLPAMRVLGQYWDRDAVGATKTATVLGPVLASELRACGVDLSFTPVLDLDFGGSIVIGERAFPSRSALLAKSLNHGLALAGMANCGKRFPRSWLRRGRFPSFDTGRRAQPGTDHGR